MDRYKQEYHNQEIIIISVANLISDINGKLIGIVKPGSNLGSRNISLIGGTAELYNQALIKKLGGFDFKGNDTEFKIPKNNLEEVKVLLSRYNPGIFEMDVTRKLKQELGEEIIGDMEEPILNKEELDELKSEYKGVVYYKGHLNPRKRDILIKHIWHLYSLNGPTEIVKKIISSSVIHLIGQGDILCGMTGDGFILKNNVIEAYHFNITNKSN